MKKSGEKKTDALSRRMTVFFLVIMFIIPVSNMTLGDDIIAGDSLLIYLSAPSYAEPEKSIKFSATAEYGNILEGTTDVTSSTSFTWDFGDGTTAQGQTVYHKYSSTGKYTVTLTGTYSGETSSTTKEITLRYLPVPDIYASTTSPRAYLDSVSFDASSSYDPDGSISSYEWDFGDGKTATGPTVSHIFKEGTYTVTLKLTDNEGYTAAAYMNINSNLPRYRITHTNTSSTDPKIYENDGILKVFWIENGTEVMVSESLDSGWTWSEASTVFSGASLEITKIEMAYDGDNMAMVVECAPPGKFPFLYVIYSNDTGNTWSDPYTLRGDESSIDMEGENIYLAYRSWSYLGQPDFILSIVIRWTSEGHIETHGLPNPEGGEFSAVPKIDAVEENGGIYVSVADYVTKRVYFWESPDNGDTWSDPVIFANLSTVGKDYFDMKATANGVYFIWSNNTLNNYELWFKVYRNGEWGDDILITNALGTSFQPEIRTDPDGYVHIIWSDFRDCVYDIYETTLDMNGNTVMTDSKISTSGGNSANPDMSFGTQKTAITNEYYRFQVWQNSGDGEIYFKNNIVDAYIGQTTESVIATIQTAQDYISSLPDDYFSNPRKRDPLIRKYDVVGNMIERGNYRAARNRIENDISPKMDGFLGGNPRNDWITVNTAQEYLGGINEILGYVSDPELPPRPPDDGSEEDTDSDIEITGVTAASTENTVHISWSVDWITPATDASFMTSITLNGETQTFDYYDTSYAALFDGLSANTSYPFDIYAEEQTFGGEITYTDTYSSTVRTQKHELKITVSPETEEIRTTRDIESNGVISGAKISWWTNNIANSTVKYREVGTDDWSVVRNAARVTEHIMILTDLKPETEYEYIVISENPNYEEKPEAEGDPFRTPPALNNFRMSTDYTSASFQWETEINADTNVYYRLPSEDRWRGPVSKSGETTDHEISIIGLWASTEYLFSVQSMKYEGDIRVIMDTATHSFITEALITNLEKSDYYMENDTSTIRGEFISWTTSEKTSVNYLKYINTHTDGTKPESEWDILNISGESTMNHMVLLVIDVMDKSERWLEDAPHRGNEFMFKVYSRTDDDQLINSTTDSFEALPDTDSDGLQDAEEEYGWTVKRDINGDGDTEDTIQYGELLYRRETLLPRGEGGEGAEIWSYWNNGDTDGDGVYDRQEKERGIHPMWEDTDYDWISDDVEINTDRDTTEPGIQTTDPLMADTDMDGLKDGEEVNTYKTNPINDDTDGDSVLDGNDMDPLVDLTITVKIKEYLQKDVESSVGLFGKSWDLGTFFVKVNVNGKWENSQRNGDIIMLGGITEKDPKGVHEYLLWSDIWDIPDDAEEIPIKIELWDDDGDTEEQLDISGNGKSCDIVYDITKGTWYGDDYLGDSNGYGHVSGDEDGSTNKFDYDADVWFDITLNDYDGDGMPTKYEVENGLNPAVNDGEDDADGDGMTNYFECKYGFDVNDPSDAEEDADGDGLLNVWEFQLGNRNPRNTRNVFRIELTVSLEWDADQDYIDKLKDAFKGASLYMMTVTDGYAYISDITIYNNKQNWDNVNIRVYNGDNPNLITEEANGYWNGADDWGLVGGEVKLYKTVNNYYPNSGYYYSQIVHELGHYVFGFADEYGYGDPYHVNDYRDNGYTIDWNSLMTFNIFYMSYHEWYDTWFYNNPNYPNTAHWDYRGTSCWEWFVQQMGRDKSLIDFSEEAMSEDYVPYGAYTAYNDYAPDEDGDGAADLPSIKINYDFSLSTWEFRYIEDFSYIYNYYPPNMDIISVMSIAEADS